MNNLSTFIKYQRKRQNLTQEELAIKAGVGLRFIRELEQGKETLQLNKVSQVLSMFGFNLLPGKELIDAYDIYWNYLNKAVKITLSNKTEKHGLIIKEILGQKDNKIAAWQFVSNKNAIKYLQKADSSLVEIIEHASIQTIEKE